ncbi:hypothetical protein G9C85_05100 [Halorubellus sp. JP-L1]|uniref:hypothetical protein n=1 Tax=Halorubellus sp. JP-L1 TaxID=2715753 RepID=UPI001409F32B|nr:hypothetical protein [Halorubellus sp. JP-L1]NHN41014.1 hypothetical protein [Halorubellus sp. JP-L1]
MPGIQHGYERGVSVIVETLIVAILIGEVVPVLVEAGLLPKNLFSGLVVFSILGIVLTIDKSRYWSFGYLAGFCIGIFIALPLFLQTRFIGGLDLLLYGGAAVSAIALRVKIHS